MVLFLGTVLLIVVPRSGASFSAGDRSPPTCPAHAFVWAGTDSCFVQLPLLFQLSVSLTRITGYLQLY